MLNMNGAEGYIGPFLHCLDSWPSLILHYPSLGIKFWISSAGKNSGVSISGGPLRRQTSAAMLNRFRVGGCFLPGLFNQTEPAKLNKGSVKGSGVEDSTHERPCPCKPAVYFAVR